MGGCMNIYEKLLKVQVELRAPKGQYNQFGKYSYRSCEDILEALKPLQNEVKATVTLHDKIVMVGDRYYVETTAKFTDCESDEVVINTAYAREDETKKGMDSSQITGSASSYARKYALNGLFCIDDVQDDDTGKETVITDSQTKTLYKELERTGIGLKSMCRNFNVTSMEELKLPQYEEALQTLKSKPDKPEAK